MKSVNRADDLAKTMRLCRGKLIMVKGFWAAHFGGPFTFHRLDRPLSPRPGKTINAPVKLLLVAFLKIEILLGVGKFPMEIPEIEPSID